MVFLYNKNRHNVTYSDFTNYYSLFIWSVKSSISSIYWGLPLICILFTILVNLLTYNLYLTTVFDPCDEINKTPSLICKQ